MNKAIYACDICGQKSITPTNWFLVHESLWDDKLQILEWNECLAKHARIHHACGASHVQELVVHWMATGRLDHPLAQPAWEMRSSRWLNSSLLASEIDIRGYKLLGELAIHRDSIVRILSENPHSLRTILSELQAALEPEAAAQDVRGANPQSPVAQFPSWEI
jgi:hypothetical protein